MRVHALATTVKMWAMCGVGFRRAEMAGNLPAPEVSICQPPQLHHTSAQALYLEPPILSLHSADTGAKCEPGVRNVGGVKPLHNRMRGDAKTTRVVRVGDPF